MMRINRAWHRAHPMPPGATLGQRIAWHQAHAAFCGCRPVPPELRKLMGEHSKAEPATLASVSDAVPDDMC